MDHSKRTINMFVIIAVTVILFTILYYYFTRNFNYWSKRKVKYEQPIPIFGSQYTNVFGYKNMTQISIELYKKYHKERVVGRFKGNTPELLIRDPELVRQILTVDFAYFYRRGLGRNTNFEPLLVNLFHAEGDTWKLLRQRLTGAFTTSKLKSMFPLVVRCAKKLQSVATAVAAQGGGCGGGECDVRELMARFTTEFIGTCGFGIEMDTINNENSQFRKLGKIIFTTSIRRSILEGLHDILPEINQYFYIGKKEITVAMIHIFRSIRDQRNGKPCGRNDFMDLLLEMKENGKLVGNSMEKNNPDGSPTQVEMELDDWTMTAQIFIFFAAGFETSSSATSFTLHQLAYNPNVQTKVQEEIDRVMLKYDNKLCYEAINEMTLLEMSLKESMRIFSSTGCLNRVCVKKYTIPGTDITIDPGVKILIPVQALQIDEKYFDKPEEFRPQRFLAETERERHKFVYLPFGEGPRACIGARLGKMQSLAGLAALLHKFTFEPGPNSTRHLTPNPWSNIVQNIQSGIPLRIRERRDKTI